MTTPATVLFVGLGAMGSRMCPFVKGAGYELLLHDLDADRTRQIAEQTGSRALGADELAAALPDVDFLVLMLPDSDAVEATITDDLLAALPSGAHVVDMGSSRPASTVALSERARRQGVGFVDAPVSGGTQRAADATLTIMVGASEPAAFEAAQPLLGCLGSQVIHVGGPGAGHALKALNNLLSAIGLAAASEVLAIGAKFGLEVRTMLDVINTATGRNHATEVKMGRFVLSRAFDSGFALDLMVKDLRMALDLGDQTGTPTPIAATAVEQWCAAQDELPDSADHTSIAAFVENRTGAKFQEPTG